MLNWPLLFPAGILRTLDFPGARGKTAEEGMTLRHSLRTSGTSRPTRRGLPCSAVMSMGAFSRGWKTIMPGWPEASQK